MTYEPTEQGVASRPLRHARLTPRRAWPNVLKGVASALAVVLIGSSGVAAYAAWDLVASTKQTVKLASDKMLESVPDVGAIDGGVNLLLVGSDSREGQGAAFGEGTKEGEGVLNDVTILLHISQDHSHAEVISIPRDTIVPVPECDNPREAGDTLSALSGVKINSVLSYGGLPCVVKTVEKLTGVTIPFVGMVQFTGVAALSEAVGGVDVCIAEEIIDPYTNTYLKPGIQSLEGIAALQFLRTRYGVGDGSDLGRISNQQVFMSALARKLQSGGVLGDPAKLYGIAKVALANMTLSDSLANPTRMIQIAKAMKDIDLNKLVLIQYPTSYVEGGGAVKPNSLSQLVNKALQADQPVAISPDADTNAFTSASGPGATATPPATPGATTSASPAATDAAGATPSPTGAPLQPTELPSGVTGQSAEETRCSAGRDGR
ncbi:MAG TPA: LCP family protein [Candidatus Lumbricidophila sp.]|nr:LCP family protein [Candidatus Lumbricidophila sp.]